MGKLKVRLIEGVNLPPGDILNRLSDPYCLLTLARGGPVMRSRTVMRCLNPRWDDEFVFFFDDDDESDDSDDDEDGDDDVAEALVVTCMDEDRLKRDDLLGTVRIPLDALPPRGGPKWYTLAGARHGELLIEAVLTPGGVNPTPTGAALFDAPGDAQPSSVGGSGCAVAVSPPTVAVAAAAAEPEDNRYTVFYSRVAGHVTKGLGQSYRRWMCYEIEMRHVARIFGAHEQPWNEAYAKARQIFAPNPMATIVRSAVRMQHGDLYARWASGRGVLRTGDDFLRLINYGVRDRAPVAFTYVLLDTKLNFSETGTTFSKDFMSKHAMHANGRRAVRFAGEFFVSSRIDGSRVLVIDNNSGTYAPAVADLPFLRAVLLENFPDLAVETYTFNDPHLEALKAEFASLQQATPRVEDAPRTCCVS